MNRFKEIRIKNNLTQEQYGEILGLTRAGVSAIEKGKNGLSEKNIEKLVKEFHISADYILGYTDNKGNIDIKLSDKVQEVIDFFNDNNIKFSQEQKNMLEYFNRLEEEDRYYIMGKMVELYRKKAPKNQNQDESIA